MRACGQTSARYTWSAPPPPPPRLPTPLPPLLPPSHPTPPPSSPLPTPPHHHQGSNRFALLLVSLFCSNLDGWLAMAERDDAGGGTGSARRRRERRLRSFLRHERMSVAKALAESTHHSAQRQKTARAGERARVELYGDDPEQLPPRRQVQSTSFSTSMKHLPPGAPCLTGSRRSGCRSGISGTPWSRSSPHRCSMFLCRCWKNSCWSMSSRRTMSRYPSRLSKCPRSSSTSSQCELSFASRSWRSCPFPRFSGLWSRT